MASEKISSNEIDQSPYIYFYEGDPLASTLDPLAIRFIESGIEPTKTILGSNFGGSDPGPDPDPDPEPFSAPLRARVSQMPKTRKTSA